MCVIYSHYDHFCEGIIQDVDCINILCIMYINMNNIKSNNKIGIKNLTNTCFANTFFQCIKSTDCLRELFKDDHMCCVIAKNIIDKNDKNNRLFNKQTYDDVIKTLAYKLHNLFVDMLKLNDNEICNSESLTTFRYDADVARWFAKGTQNDFHEFFVRVMNRVNQEMLMSMYFQKNKHMIPITIRPIIMKRAKEFAEFENMNINIEINIEIYLRKLVISEQNFTVGDIIKCDDNKFIDAYNKQALNFVINRNNCIKNIENLNNKHTFNAFKKLGENESLSNKQISDNFKKYIDNNNQSIDKEEEDIKKMENELFNFAEITPLQISDKKKMVELCNEIINNSTLMNINDNDTECVKSIVAHHVNFFLEKHRKKLSISDTDKTAATNAKQTLTLIIEEGIKKSSQKDDIVNTILKSYGMNDKKDLKTELNKMIDLVMCSMYTDRFKKIVRICELISNDNYDASSYNGAYNEVIKNDFAGINSDTNAIFDKNKIIDDKKEIVNIVEKINAIVSECFTNFSKNNNNVQYIDYVCDKYCEYFKSKSKSADIKISIKTGAKNKIKKILEFSVLCNFNKFLVCVYNINYYTKFDTIKKMEKYIGDDYESSVIDTPLNLLISSCILTTKTCSMCHYVSSVFENTCLTILNIHKDNETKSLSTLFKKHMDVELLNIDQKVSCVYCDVEKKKHTLIKKKPIFVNTPEALYLSISRHKYNNELNNEKINIDLKLVINSANYNLVAIGCFQSNHYVAYVNYNNDWYEHSDSATNKKGNFDSIKDTNYVANGAYICVYQREHTNTTNK